MMSWSHRCYIPSFVEIGLLILEKKIFEGFLPYNVFGHDSYLGPEFYKQIFMSLYIKPNIQNLVKNVPVVSVKISFNFHM